MGNLFLSLLTMGFLFSATEGNRDWASPLGFSFSDVLVPKAEVAAEIFGSVATQQACTSRVPAEAACLAATFPQPLLTGVFATREEQPLQSGLSLQPLGNPSLSTHRSPYTISWQSE